MQQLCLTIEGRSASAGTKVQVRFKAVVDDGSCKNNKNGIFYKNQHHSIDANVLLHSSNRWIINSLQVILIITTLNRVTIYARLHGPYKMVRSTGGEKKKTTPSQFIHWFDAYCVV